MPRKKKEISSEQSSERECFIAAINALNKQKEVLLYDIKVIDMAMEAVIKIMPTAKD